MKFSLYSTIFATGRLVSSFTAPIQVRKLAMALPAIPTLLSGPEAISLFAQKRAKFLDGSWHLGNPRKGEEDYRQKRIPGASFFSIDDIADQDSGLPHMIPTDGEFSDKVSKLGISSDDHVIVYTAPGSFSGPRVWWMFKLFGHEKVSIINGGIEEWIKEGGPIEGNETEDSTATEAIFVASLNPKMVVDWKKVLSIVENGSAQILDARSEARFVCKAPEPRPGLPGGHIPGSLNLPFTKIVYAEDFAKFRPVEEIKKAFEDAGLVLGSKVVTTCGSGVTACALTLGLHLIGEDLENVPVYDGSWTEWGGREDLPKIQLNQPKDL